MTLNPKAKDYDIDKMDSLDELEKALKINLQPIITISSYIVAI